ncbi:cyclic nucleotide-binding domain-containing protein [Sporomusa aerivorans]|uniref:cyclic nucleotide-binding domain-containing protein n=1 Tax=Sporomusa aerivorans TaxID=204936 RepID=UPI00352A262A
MENRQLQSENAPVWENVKIYDAYTQAEKKAIYRFRYQVHVKEMSRSIPGTDHIRQQVIDELDPWSDLAYAALDNGQIIGAVRATVGMAKDFPDELIRIFKLNRFQEFDDNNSIICFGTKMMVDPLYRGTPVFFKLMVKSYEYLREHNIDFNFGGCNPYLLPMYEQLGYRRFTSGFQDPGYGFVVPILLLPKDIEHFAAIRSPYLRIAKKYSNSTAAREWYLANFPEAARYPVNLFVSEQERLNSVRQLIGQPLNNISLLANLNEAEIKGLLQIAMPVDCKQGSGFIHLGDVCNELNLLIAGKMQITDQTGAALLANAGDVLGSVGLFEQAHHQIDAKAATECEILTVSRFSFEKLQRSCPEIGEKLRINQHKEAK